MLAGTIVFGVPTPLFYEWPHLHCVTQRQNTPAPFGSGLYTLHRWIECLVIHVVLSLDVCTPPHLANYILAGIALPSVRRTVAQDMEYGKMLHDLAHPIFGQVSPTKRLKSRSFLDCTEEIVTTPQTEELKRWKVKHLYD